ncbi:hypothetical protein Hdeb2414_s0002g00062661 [Helianthus debilis subsp. tardiflorus]
MIMISAQETVRGQAVSSASLISSTTSYDRNESMFDKDSFSPSIVGVSSNNIDPSHPCQSFIPKISVTRQNRHLIA